MTTLRPRCADGAISNGDGSFQYRSAELAAAWEIRVRPNVTRVAPGIVELSTKFHGNAGEWFDITPGRA